MRIKTKRQHKWLASTTVKQDGRRWEKLAAAVLVADAWRGGCRVGDWEGETSVVWKTTTPCECWDEETRESQGTKKRRRTIFKKDNVWTIVSKYWCQKKCYLTPITKDEVMCFHNFFSNFRWTNYFVFCILCDISEWWSFVRP